MGLKKERFELVQSKDNNGSDSFDTEMIVTKDVLDHIGKKELKKIRKRIGKLLSVKRQIYGYTHETDDMCEFPYEIYFRDKITGAIVSFTQVEVEEVLNSPKELFLVGKHNPEKEPLHINSKEANHKLIEYPYLVQFRPDLCFPKKQ